MFNQWLISYRSRFPVWLAAALLALVTMALYWPATQCDFINYDDPVYVTANPQVQGGLNWEGLQWAFRNPVCCNWQPLTVLSHMADCQFFGLKPWGHHLTSVLLHAVNTLLVFLLLYRLTAALWRSVLVAALFGLHPLQVESVAWVAERNNVLSACFGLLSLIFYVRYANKVTGGKWPLNYLLSLVFFACGLTSKAVLVTWPFVMLLLDYWPLRRMTSDKWQVTKQGNWKWLLLEKLPFFALTVVASVVTFLVQQREGALRTVQNLPLGARVGNALISYCRYLGKLFWPIDLAVFYPHPGYWPIARVLLAGGLFLGIAALLIVKWRRYPFLLMGWLWYCGTLVPVIQLVQTGAHAMADRYTYVPSLGVFTLAIWGAYALTQRWRFHVIALSVTGAAAIVLCLALTRLQIGYWKDGEALFRHGLEVAGNNPVARNNLGGALDSKGQIDEAISQFQEAIRLRPDFYDAHNNLGTALGRKGQMDEAISQFQEAIRLRPDFYDAHNNLGTAFFKKGQMDKAITQFQESIRLKPDDAAAHDNLGTTLERKGQIDGAITQFREAVRLNPANAMAHNNLGVVLVNKGQLDEAIRQYQEAIRLKPDYTEARNNLGIALGMKGKAGEAIGQHHEAIRLPPDDAAAHNNLGIDLGRKGQTDEAIIQFQEALRLKPDYAEAHNNLGIALGTKGQTDEAIIQFQEALRLNPDDAVARKNLGIALGRKGQIDGARK